MEYDKSCTVECACITILFLFLFHYGTIHLWMPACASAVSCWRVEQHRLVDLRAFAAARL